MIHYIYVCDYSEANEGTADFNLRNANTFHEGIGVLISVCVWTNWTVLKAYECSEIL